MEPQSSTAIPPHTEAHGEKESTFEEEKKHHFRPQDLANAIIHDNAFLSCCLGPDRYASCSSTPFSLIVLGPPYDGIESSGGSRTESLSHWFSSSSNDRPFLKSLWKTAAYRVCCDGAYDMVLKSGGDSLIKPDLLIGRLDELNEQTKAEIERERNDKTKVGGAGIETSSKKTLKEWNEVEMVRDHSDEWTDLQKAMLKMKEQKEKFTSNPSLHHTVVCYYDGPVARLDKMLSHISALYQFHTVFPRCLLLTDSASITELLLPGHHILLPNKELEGVYSSCGIFPIGSVCKKIYATGLHWPLHGDTLAFGGLVSTCNAIVSERVLIENSDPVIFTTNLMTMTAPLQKIRSLSGKEGVAERTKSAPSPSLSNQPTVASFGSSTAPKSLSFANNERMQSSHDPRMSATDKNDPPIHHEHGFAQHESLVPDPSVISVPAAGYRHPYTH